MVGVCWNMVLARAKALAARLACLSACSTTRNKTIETWMEKPLVQSHPMPWALSFDSREGEGLSVVDPNLPTGDAQYDGVNQGA